MQDNIDNKTPLKDTYHRSQLVSLLHLSLLCFCLLLSSPSSISAQPKNHTSSHAWLRQRLNELVNQSKLSEKIGVAILDTRSERMIFSHNGNLPLNPASNMKLVTSATAMWELGPNFRMQTGLYGSIEGDSIVGGLFLKGFGDPTLSFTDLLMMARQVVSQGVRQVDEIIVDGSYFDNQFLPPAFDQQPNEISAFRAPVGAVSVDRNAYDLVVRAGPDVNSKALISLQVPGYFELENEIITIETGNPNIIAIQHPKETKLQLRLRGNIPRYVSKLSYRRRIHHPLTYAGYAMVEALRTVRISVPRRVNTLKTPTGLPLLASHHSATLNEILQALGKNSDNFVAEMILKVIGAERVRVPGRSSDGIQIVRSVLKRIGIPLEHVAIVNGSGLFNGNKIAASHLVRLLAAIYNDASIRSEYLGHLSVGGVDGTLSRRFQHLPMTRIVRAKTGTLRDVVALSGYVIGPMPERVIAFSIMANKLEGNHRPAKQLADSIVQAIASHLWGD